MLQNNPVGDRSNTRRPGDARVVQSLVHEIHRPLRNVDRSGGKRPQILVVQQHSFAPPGVIGSSIVDAGGELTIIDILGGDRAEAIAVEDFDGLIVLGGIMSAVSDACFPRIADLLRTIREFHDRQKPYLGICLGAQLLARTLGGEPRCGLILEAGLTELRLTECATTDPLLKGLPRELHFMQMHEDSFTLPEHAALLMTGEAYENQAFRAGPTSYGLQFHPEVDLTILQGWCAMLNATAPGAETDRKVGMLMADTDLGLDCHISAARTLANNWLSIVRTTMENGMAFDATNGFNPS